MNFDDDEYDFNDNDLDNLDFHFSESEDSDIAETQENSHIDLKERVKMIRMRSNINTLKDNFKEKEKKYTRIKDELAICDNHLQELKKEEEMTFAAIESNKSSGNLAASYRLQGQLKRVILEQEGERDLQLLIKKKLVEAEKEYIKAQLEEGKCLSDEMKLKEEENKYQRNQKKIYNKRLNKEQKLTINTKKSLELKQNEISQSSEERNAQQINLQRSIAEAHSKHEKFLLKTSKEQREQKLKNEKIKLDEHKKFEISTQKLNSDILQTKENMTAINAKRKADKMAEAERENILQLSTIEKGGNPMLELKKYRNNIKTSNNNEKLQTQINQGKIKIADKISGEEKNMLKKKQLLPYLFPESAKEIKKNGITKADLISTKKITNDLKEPFPEEWERWDVRSSAGRSSVNQITERNIIEGVPSNFDDSTEIHIENVTRNYFEEGERDINAPEFQGLWDTTVDYKVSMNSQNLPIKDENASKMEQEIMERVLKQLKENIVQPQIVGGKLFKGKSFQSKPEVIQFENLEVGEIYNKKIILTNTSYGTNQCRFERISEHLLDFISIKFSPSGPLSPGMTFEFTVTFEPKLSQDLFGEVFFTSQSERFSIPLVCLTKKCKMTINKQLIKFDTSVIGETLVQSIILKNSGAKGTFCSIKNNTKVEDQKNVQNQENTGDQTIVEESVEESIEERSSYDHVLDEYDCITTSLGDNTLWIEPFNEQEVMVKWSPTIAGDYLKNFFISFEDEDNKGFDLQVMGKAIDVPVYITEPVISMNICMVDRLYQDTIIFKSRAATALKMTFNVPKEVQNYLEILPNMGFIQAGQEFKSQLKLLVKSSFYKENCPFFDSDTGILDVPIVATIANQVKTVDFNVQAVLTVTDLKITSQGTDPSLIDFGFCTINETKIMSLKLRNQSILSQEFGFTGYPEFIEIQPNHGYGVIFPKEELEFQVMFSPKKAENFQFQVRCQTVIDRSFSLSCVGVGVHPSLEFSKQIITFPHTAINDTSSVDVFLSNNHKSINIYTHEPPRIGMEPVIPIGPKTYNIIIPENNDVTIHPRVATIVPGEKQKLTIFFKPKLSVNSIKNEASEIQNSELEKKVIRKWEEEIKDLERQKENDSGVEVQQPEKTEVKGKKPTKKVTRPNSSKSKSEDFLSELIKSGPSKFTKVEPEQIIVDSDEYLKAKLSLLKKSDFNFEIIKATCLIANGTMLESDKLVYDYRNVLYLELHCPSVMPDLVILSNNGRTFIDFRKIILKHRITRVISVQNISSNVIKLKSSHLDPNGAYQICNALREVEPNAVANIVVSFYTNVEGIYESNWSLSGEKRTKTLNLRFRGVAITPKVEIKEIKDGIMKLGTVLINEYVEKPVTLVNNSVIDIQYKLTLSLDSGSNTLLGVHNRSGMSPFSLTPYTGLIPAGKSETVTISFAPDHESSNFMGLGTLYLFEKVKIIDFLIEGESKSNILYLKSQNRCIPKSLDYLGQAWTINSSQSEESSVINKEGDDIVLVLEATLSEKGTLVEGYGTFIIGCVRTMALSQKKNGEFIVDNMSSLTLQGFNVDVPKGQIEADTEKEIRVSWIPPQQYEIGTVISSVINITLKGDTSSSYVIELRAYVK